MVKNVRALFTWPLGEINAFRVPKKDFDMKVPTLIYNAMCMHCYKFSHKGLKTAFLKGHFNVYFNGGLT